MNYRICEGSRWMAREAGELVVWKVLHHYSTGQNEHAQVTGYLLQREGKPVWKQLAYPEAQQLVHHNRLIPIYHYTREQWILMSNPY